MKPVISKDAFSKIACDPAINPGDLVMRKYTINIPNITHVGLVVNRDRNGFLDVTWGSKMEYMWDDYDLVRLE